MNAAERAIADYNWLTVQQVAAQLEVSSFSVRRFIATGTLKATNLGTRVRPRYKIRPADLDTFLRERSTG